MADWPELLQRYHQLASASALSDDGPNEALTATTQGEGGALGPALDTLRRQLLEALRQELVLPTGAVAAMPERAEAVAWRTCLHGHFDRLRRMLRHGSMDRRNSVEELLMRHLDLGIGFYLDVLMRRAPKHLCLQLADLFPVLPFINGRRAPTSDAFLAVLLTRLADLHRYYQVYCPDVPSLSLKARRLYETAIQLLSGQVPEKLEERDDQHQYMREDDMEDDAEKDEHKKKGHENGKDAYEHEREEKGIGAGMGEVWGMAHNHLGVLLTTMGERDLAVYYYCQATRCRETEASALQNTRALLAKLPTAASMPNLDTEQRQLVKVVCQWHNISLTRENQF